VRVIRRLSLPVLLSYLFCSFLFTYPLVFRLTTHVPGEVEGDVPVYIWNLWWMKQALSEGVSPLFCDYIFAPYGASLAFHAFVFLKAFLAIPLQLIFSAWTAYNILILATFALAGYGMFLLARHLTGDDRAAWIAGLVYAFSPYMLTRGTGHLNYLSSEWIPLYALCLIRLLETRERRWALGGALCLLLTAYCEYYYLIYLTLFTAIYLGWQLRREKAAVLDRTFLKHFALMGAVAAVGFAPVLWMLFGTAQSGYLYGGWGASAKLGADLLAFVTPPPGSLLYGDIGAGLYEVFSGGNAVEGTVFAGYLVLGLAATCIARLRHDESLRPWLWLTLIFFLLSLGPLLHVGGDFVFGFGPVRFAVPLPYVVVRYLPLIKGARVPARFDIMIVLGLAVLSAYGVRYWLERVDRPGRWTVAIVILIALEYLRIPYPVAPVDVPVAYEKVARDERDLVVMDVPLGWRTGWGSTGRSFDRQQLYQIVHGKRLLGGFASRVPEDELRRMADLPGIGQLLALQEELSPPHSPTAARRPFIRAQMRELIEHLPDILLKRLMREASVRNFLDDTSTERQIAERASREGVLRDLVDAVELGYVFVHPPYSGHAPLRRYLEKGLPLEKFYERDGVLGYRVVERVDH
jgi:hypothetical protein